MARIFTLLILTAIAFQGVLAGEESQLVSLGAVMSLSGDGAERDALLAHGYLAAVDAVNEAGGVLIAGRRHPIRLEMMDDQGSHRRAAALAEVLVMRRDVSLFLGGANPATTGAVVAIAAEHDRPVVDALGFAVGEDSEADMLSVVPAVEQRISALLNGLLVAFRLAGRNPSTLMLQAGGAIPRRPSNSSGYRAPGASRLRGQQRLAPICFCSVRAKLLCLAKGWCSIFRVAMPLPWDPLAIVA